MREVKTRQNRDLPVEKKTHAHSHTHTHTHYGSPYGEGGALTKRSS